MKKWSSIFFMIALPGAADPFYGEQQIVAEEQVVAVANHEENLPACGLPENIRKRHLPITFEQLKFIGVLKNDGQTKALLMNEQKQIFDMQVNDLLTEEQIQIIHIDLRSLHYIDWRKVQNCKQPAAVVLQL